MKQFDNLVPPAVQGEAAKTEDISACPLCGGSGVNIDRQGNAVICPCFQQKRLQLLLESSLLPPQLLNKSFANFDLRYYSRSRQDGSGRTYREIAVEALEAAQKFVRARVGQRQGNGLLFIGHIGSGKTHLSAALACELCYQGISVLFLVVPDFLDTLRASYDKSGEFSEDDLMERARQAEVLILDDIGAQNITPWSQEKIYSLINYRLNYQKPCVLTSNHSMEELNVILGYRTTSRILEACRLYQLCIDNDIRSVRALEER